MIDVHSHVLPLLDDGADSIETALDMLDMAYRDGTDAMILTPHYACEYGFDNPHKKIVEYFQDFKEIVKQEGIPIKLYLGCEFLFSSIEAFYEYEEMLTTINDTNYILIEFYFDVEEDFVLEAVDTVMQSGKIPILAHPERYECMQISIEPLKKAIQKGALLQINKGSLSGRYGKYAKQTAIELLDRQYVSFVGSDCHHINYRTPKMYDAYDFVLKCYGEDYASAIFRKNAEDLLNIKG